MKARIMYIELKTHPGGHDDRGPARICRATFSKTGRTVYYKHLQLHRMRPVGCANHYDVASGDEYWVSGPKKNGEDRYSWASSAPVDIDEDVREEYWTSIRNQPERQHQSTT